MKKGIHSIKRHPSLKFRASRPNKISIIVSMCFQVGLSATDFIMVSSEFGLSEWNRINFEIAGERNMRNSLGIRGKCLITLAGIL
jgi:hypothetical protein